MEAGPHDAIQHRVQNRQDGHALMMRHVGAHDRHRLARGYTRRRVIKRLIKPKRAKGAQSAQTVVVEDGGAGIDHGSKAGGIGRNHRAFTQPAFKRQIGNPKVGILIGHVKIAGIISGFRHAPGNAQKVGVFDLPPDGEAVGRGQQTARGRPHDQRGHQILEHRARPGDQHRAAIDRRDRPAQPEPVGDGQFASGDGEEAREAGFRCQKIVAALIQLVVAGAIADGQQMPVGINEKVKPHLIREDHDPAGDVVQAAAQGSGGGAAPGGAGKGLIRLRAEGVEGCFGFFRCHGDGRRG